MTTSEDIKYGELLERVNLSGLSFDDMLLLSDIISEKAWQEEHARKREFVNNYYNPLKSALTPFLCSK